MNDYVKQGWVRVHRKSIDSTVWKNPNVWFVWSWCLLKANHQAKTFPFNGDDITIERGQFITGIEKAIAELKGLSYQNYRTCISYLQKTGRVVLKPTNKFTIITIVKYEEYQKDDDKLTKDQQTTNKRLTTNNNNKNNIYNIGVVETPPSDITMIINLFKDINPAYKKWFGNRTQRSAIEGLIKTHGIEQVVKVIAILPKTNKMSWITTITTPQQLEDRWATLEAQLIKEKNKGQVNNKKRNYI